MPRFYARCSQMARWDCKTETQKSLTDTLDLLRNGKPEDVASKIIKFWHASGACSAGICFDKSSGVVKDTANVYIGDTSSFPFPISAHTSVPSNVAGTIA